MRFVVYDLATGLIDAVGNAREDLIQYQKGEGQEAVAVPGLTEIDAATQYISDNTLTTRPEMGLSLDRVTIAADGVDVATLSGIPAGATCYAQGQQITVDDGTLEITSDNPGSIEVRVMAPPYQDASVLLEAT